ncbi:MAG: O-antigen ligase family protein, partial [bacterium]
MTFPAIQTKPDRLYPLLAMATCFLIAFIIGQISAGVAAGVVLGAIVAMIGLAQYEALIHALIILLPMQSALPVSLQSLGTLNPFNLLTGVMFAVWLVNGVIRQERLLNRSWMNVVVLLFVLACIAALFNSGRLYGAGFMEAQINPLKRWISPVLLFFPIANSRLTRPAMKRLVYTTICMIFVVAVWMVKDIYNVGWHNISTETRLGGPFGFGGENDIAAFLVYYPVIALTIALIEKRLLPRIFLLGVFGVSIFPLILSMSRGAYLGMAAGMVFIGIMRFRWLLPIVLIAGLGYKMWVPGAVQQRLDSTVISSNETVGGRVPGPHEIERDLEESAALRVRIWRGAVSIIENNPVMGVGYNAFQMAIPKYANMEWGMDAHNMYLRIAAEMGVGGFAV